VINLTDKQKSDLMLSVFFKTQAAIEKYCGKEKLPEWTNYVAKQFSDNIRELTKSKAEAERRVIMELAEVLTVYGSDYEIIEDNERLILDVKFCGIFKYRKKSAEEGIELTLDLPCEFCTDFRQKVANQLDIKNISYELHNCGCKWIKNNFIG